MSEYFPNEKYEDSDDVIFKSSSENLFSCTSVTGEGTIIKFQTALFNLNNINHSTDIIPHRKGIST